MTSFYEKLIHIKHATSNQRQKEVWNVEGIIEGHSNQRFRFDTRPLKNDCKKGYFKTKADKIVFDINKLSFSKNSNLKLSGPLLYISFEALKLLDFESFLPFFEKIIKMPHIFNLYLICI